MIEDLLFRKDDKRSPQSKQAETVNIVLLDTLYFYSSFNDVHKEAVYKAWGIEIADGMNLLELIPESEERDLVHKNLDRALAGEVISQVKEYGEFEKKVMESVYSPMRSTSGEVVGISVYSTDISERINREKISKEREQHHIFDNMLEGFALCEIICDENNTPIDYKILQVNKAYEAQTGINACDIVGKTVLNFYPDIEKSWIEIYGDIALTQKPKVFTDFNHNTNKYYETSAFSPEIGKFALIFRDVTESKKAEDQIRKLSQAIEQAGYAIMITDKEGVIEYVNQAFTKLSGYSPEEAIGQSSDLLKSDDQSASFYEDMRITSANNKIWQGKITNKKKDGTFYPVMLSLASIVNNDGVTTHFVGSYADLSELEGMEEQFRQSQKMEAIGTLVGGIAHDFNNMLAGITGNLFLAKEALENTEYVENKLGNIESLAFRAADLIKQLLTFARKDQVKMEYLPLVPFIKNTYKFIHTSIPENISMHLNISDNNLVVRCDITQLQQVLINLVNNARDAVENAKEPSIFIDVESFDCDDVFIEKHPLFKRGEYAHISVTDNGCGIPKHQLEHIFEPFFTTKEPGKGTGLGLAMVFGAIRTHHAHIYAESSVNHGSTFHVYLPLFGDKIISSDALNTEELTKGRSQLILLVDDEDSILEISIAVLKSLGYRTLTASDGLEALKVFMENKDDISLIIMDVVMPKLGGVEAAARIREIDPNVKIIFNTGYDRGQLFSNKDLHKHTVLAKPYTIEELSNSIRDLLAT
ncbi:MAG: PAS domain S-box-containing protein [Glaciecola sp.]